MSSLTRQLEQARAELQQNTRLRLGVWLILIIAIVYVLLVQSDRNDGARADYAGQLERLRKAQHLSGQDGWNSALSTAQERSDGLQSLFWEAETEGLAQASLQAALNEMISGLQIRNPRLRSGASQPVNNLPDVWQVQTQLEGTYRKGAELQLLYAIAQHPKQLVIDRLDLSRQNSRLLVLVSAYFVGIPPETQ